MFVIFFQKCINVVTPGPAISDPTPSSRGIERFLHLQACEAWAASTFEITNGVQGAFNSKIFRQLESLSY